MSKHTVVIEFDSASQACAFVVGARRHFERLAKNSGWYAEPFRRKAEALSRVKIVKVKDA